MRSVSAKLLILGLALISGCATAPDAGKRIEAFSSATALTTRNLRASIDAVEAAHYEKEIDNAIAADTWRQLSIETVRPLLDEKDVQIRVTVLKGIEAYAEKLSLIMGNAPLDSFDTASKGLGASLTKLNGTAVKEGFSKSGLSEGEIQGLTTAVNGIGRWIIEARRAKSARAAITEMEPNIKAVAAALQKDFAWLQRQIIKDYDEALMSQKVALSKAENTLSLSEKRAWIQHLGAFLREGKEASDAMKAAGDAVKQLADTHTQLADAFKKNSPALDESIKSLWDEGQRIGAFYQSLKSK